MRHMVASKGARRKILLECAAHLTSQFAHRTTMQKTTTTLATLGVIGLLTAGLAAQESNWSHWGIEFSNSGATEAQQPFIRGVTALHLHMFEDAEAHFQQAQRVLSLIHI